MKNAPEGCSTNAWKVWNNPRNYAMQKTSGSIKPITLESIKERGIGEAKGAAGREGATFGKEAGTERENEMSVMSISYGGSAPKPECPRK